MSFEKVILLLVCMYLSAIIHCTINTTPNIAMISPILTTNQFPNGIILPKKLSEAVSEDV